MAGPRNPRIGFVLLQGWPSMGVVDMNLISQGFPTRVWRCWTKLRYLIDAIMIFFLVASTNLSVTRWAHIQAYWQVRWAKLLGKKTLVIIGGGADTVDEEWLGRKYTQQHVKMLSFVLNNATRLLANSEYIRGTLWKYTARDDVPVVYDGFDPSVYDHDGRKKESLVITICPLQRLDVKRKGIETFVRAASRFPDARFVVIGSFLDDSIDHLRSMAPPNVEFTGGIDDAAKIEYMRRAKVYAQLSSVEGCPWAISEAMLCECIPVTTKGGGIPEIVGETGYYAQYGDVEATAQAFALALRDYKDPRAARARIVAMFSLERRKENLVAEIRRLVTVNRGKDRSSGA